MSRKILIVAAILTIAAVIMTTAGCGGSTTTSSASNSGASSQSTAQPAGTGQQPQQGQGQGTQGTGQRGQGIDNTKLLTRVAAILNVSVDKLTTAFNNAMPKRTEGDKSGTPPTGTAPTGTPPTGSGTPPTGTPAAGQQGQPVQQGQFTLPDDVIQKIATELGLSADTVSSAFKQATAELQSSSSSK